MDSMFFTNLSIFFLSVYILQWIDAIIRKWTGYQQNLILNSMAAMAITYLIYNYLLTF